MRYGEERYGEEYTQGLQDFQDRFSLKTQQQIQWVGRVPFSNRLEDLSFWLHMEVVSLCPAKLNGQARDDALAVQRGFLERCRDDGWSRRKLANEVRKHKKQEKWGPTEGGDADGGAGEHD